MKRRDFLQKGALAGIGLASFPTVLTTLPSVSASGNQTNFHFVANSAVPAAPHRLAIAGDGKIGPSNVEGNGSFVHWLAPVPPAPMPATIVGSGTWKAKSLISFTTIGTWGVFKAGILKMNVELDRDIPTPGVIPAVLKQVCNIGPAHLLNGVDEGVFLDVPAVPLMFEPAPALFKASSGVTVFTTDVETEG